MIHFCDSAPPSSSPLEFFMRQYLSRGLLIVSVVLVSVACSGSTTTAAPTATATPTASATSTATATRTATAAPTASVAPASAAPTYNITSTAADLTAAIPATIAPTCVPNTSTANDILASMSCTADGVSGIEYDQFDTSADLQAYFQAQVSSTTIPVTPDNAPGTTCETQNFLGVWSFTSSGNKVTGPDFRLLCNVGSGTYNSGAAYTSAFIVQADPTNNVFFIVWLDSKKGANDNVARTALYQWWLNADTTVSVQP
jgi:hypothetical protein